MNQQNQSSLISNETSSQPKDGKVLQRLKQELSFISAFKNMDQSVSHVEKEIEQYVSYLFPIHLKWGEFTLRRIH